MNISTFIIFSAVLLFIVYFILSISKSTQPKQATDEFDHEGYEFIKKTENSISLEKAKELINKKSL